MTAIFVIYQSSTDETKCSQTSDEEIKCSQAQSQRQPVTLQETKDSEQLLEYDSDSESETTLPGNIIFLENNLLYIISGCISCLLLQRLKRGKSMFTHNLQYIVS